MIYFFGGEAPRTGRAEALLPTERRIKYERLHREQDKKNCLFAYLLLQYALKREFGLSRFKLAEGTNGKPYIAENDSVHFNLSHSDTGVAVIVGVQPVGIDMQPLTKAKNSICNRVCSEKEIDFIQSHEEPDLAFTRLWTLKESAVKRRGETLADIKNYDFAACPNQFMKYSDRYSVFRIDNTWISACSYEFYDKIITVTKGELY